MTAADRDTLVDTLSDILGGPADYVADDLLASDWLAARDRRVAAQTLRDAANEARRGWELLNKPSGEMTPDDWTALQAHPLRYLGQWLEPVVEWLDALVDRAATTEGTHHD